MELEIILVIIGLIITIIWNLINTYLSLKNRKLTKIQLKIPALKKDFNELYSITKEIINRIEFSESVEKSGYIIYPFKIKMKDSNDFVDFETQKSLIERWNHLWKNTGELSNYGTETIDMKVNDISRLGIRFDYSSFSYPNDKRPNNTEEIKENFKKMIIASAKIMGIKLR